MAIFNTTDRTRLWRYKVRELKFISDTETFNIPPERTISINIEENFEENLFPLFDIKITIEASRYYKIVKNKDSGKLYLRIDRYYQYQNDKTQSSFYPFIDDIFSIVMDKSPDDMLKSLKQQEAIGTFTSQIKNDVNDLAHSEDGILHLYLFKPYIIGATKASINAVLKDVSIVDSIGYILKVAGIDSVVMAKPDNTTKYPTLFIPPLSALKALTFVDSYYGIYKKGSIMYFGLKENYIIPYSGECQAFIPGELKNITIMVPSAVGDSSHGISSGDLQRRDDTEYHYLVANYKTVVHSERSVSNNYLAGNNIRMIDSFTGDITLKKSNAKSQGENLTRTQVVRTENPFISDIYVARSNTLSDVFTLDIGSINLNDLSPNKRYTLVFEDNELTIKYRGNYIMSYEYTEFIRDGDDFASNTHLVIKKDT